MKRAKNKYAWVLLTVIVVSLQSCVKEIQLDLADHKPRIVMNGIISPDSLIEIGVTKSFLFNNYATDNNRLQNASLTLFINGEKREKMQLAQTDSIFHRDRFDINYMAEINIFRSTLRPRIGDRIRIEASADGFDTVWAEITVPAPPTINRIDAAPFVSSKKIINPIINDSYYPYDSKYIWNLETEEFYRNMRIKMDVTYDSPGRDHYFTLQLKTMFRPEKESYLYLYTNDDPIFNESYHNSILEDIVSDGGSSHGIKHLDMLFFSDKRFINHSYTLDFSITDYYDMQSTPNVGSDTGEGVYNSFLGSVTKVLNPPVEVAFSVISPELYSYFKMRNHDLTSEPVGFIMFSEPEPTLSNVHNGVGIVGVLSGTKALIDTPPYPGGRERIPKWK